MLDKAHVVEEIERVLATETRAAPFSNRLFTPHGLFSLLASTDEERELLVESELFIRAQDRLTELELMEADRLDDSAIAPTSALFHGGVAHPIVESPPGISSP
jgi:hypothetical protein